MSGTTGIHPGTLYVCIAWHGHVLKNALECVDSFHNSLLN